MNHKLKALSIWLNTHGFIKEANNSPIMEMIQHVAVSTFPLDQTEFGNRLIIISDMIQNVDDFSMSNE